MKKLRLIKPWRLRTVRQSLSVRESADVQIQNVACCGPSLSAGSEGQTAFFNRNANISNLADLQENRIVQHISGSPESNFGNPIYAPVSDVIFVSINTTTR